MEKKYKLDEQVAGDMVSENTGEMPVSDMGTPMPEAPITQAETPEEQPEMEEEEEAPNMLIAIVQKYLPGEEVTEENVNEMAAKVIERLSGIQDNLAEIADEYPEFAMFLRDVLKGMPLEEAVARNLDDITNPPEGAPDWENINKGREERKTRLGEKKSQIESLEKNKQVSVENAQAFIQETGLAEPDAIKFLDWFDGLSKDMFDGLITKNHFNTLYKAYNYDNDMAGKDAMMKEEVETAKAAGRNEQIVSKKVSAETGDGIPKLGSSGGRVPQKKKTFADDFMSGVV